MDPYTIHNIAFITSSNARSREPITKINNPHDDKVQWDADCPGLVCDAA